MALIVHMSLIVQHARYVGMLDTPPVLARMTDYCPISCLEQILDLVILRENTSVPFDWYYLSPFDPCAPLSGSQYRPTFGQQYLENGKNKHCLCQTFFKEYSASFLMICRLIDVTLVVYCHFKNGVFQLSGTERVNVCWFVFEEYLVPCVFESVIISDITLS